MYYTEYLNVWKSQMLLYTIEKNVLCFIFIPFIFLKCIENDLAELFKLSVTSLTDCLFTSEVTNNLKSGKPKLITWFHCLLAEWLLASKRLDILENGIGFPKNCSEGNILALQASNQVLITVTTYRSSEFGQECSLMPKPIVNQKNSWL